MTTSTTGASGSTATQATTQNWASPGAGQSVAPPAGSDMATKEVFLQLLVAQIKNQNPLNPMDGVEFLSQLSQFTQVEQTLGMRQDLGKILTAIEKGATAGNGGSASGAGTTGAGTTGGGTRGSGTTGSGATGSGATGNGTTGTGIGGSQ